VSIIVEWEITVVIAGHVLACREHKVVQARREVGVAVDRLVDRIVFETDV
jgi:hypothetical protein